MDTNRDSSKLPMFQSRFKQIRNEMLMSQADFASFLEISRATVGFYESGDRVPDALVLKRICENCSVTSDWLLGLSDNKQVENMDIGKKLGLSDTSIAVLTNCKERETEAGIAFVNLFFENLVPIVVADNLELFFKIVNSIKFDNEYHEILNISNSTFDWNDGIAKLPPRTVARLFLLGIEDAFSKFIQDNYATLIKLPNENEGDENGKHSED